MRPISKRPLQWYLDRHHELWQWLVENSIKQKYEWPGWNRFKRNYHYSCFACQYLIDYGCVKEDNSIKCGYCLFEWTNGGGLCQELESAYHKWEDERDPTNRSILANHIKYMPIRKCYQKELGDNECP